MIPTVLTIAGSDSSGGAGIQADLKTIAAHKLYGESVITALTAQNTMGVQGVMEVDPDFVTLQIRTVFEDIRPDAVKIGMVSNAEIAKAIASTLVEVGARHIVVDPVMVATSGSALIGDGVIDTLIEVLLPLAEVVTPNIPEAAALSGVPIEGTTDMTKAARVIQQMIGEDKWVLVKGGHLDDSADDLLLTEHGREVWLNHKRINTVNTHGTGCTLSTAIACGLAQDFDVQASISKAKNFISGALEADLGMGRGNGPLDHMWDYR